MRAARTPTQKQIAKSKATNILKRKKMYEAHLNTLAQTQMNVECTQIQTEMMKDNMEIMTTLKGTAQIQKEMMKSMDIDDIYNLMDDMKELQNDQEEMNEAFTKNYEVDVCDEELDAGILNFYI
jgi:hypothetical protein